jgi:YggT family protein
MKELLLLLIHYGFWFIQLVVLAHVILSWVIMVQRPRWMYHPVVRWVEDTAFQILRPFRLLLERIGLRTGPIDFTPLVALLVLGFVADLLKRVVWGLPIP